MCDEVHTAHCANSPDSPFLPDILYDYTKGNFTVTGPTATASIFSTYPHPCVSLLGGFFTEVSGDS